MKDREDASALLLLPYAQISEISSRSSNVKNCINIYHWHDTRRKVAGSIHDEAIFSASSRNEYQRE
jgi:hypothetical protein